MGALHEGHLSLVRKSLRENQCTVVSIFVNPIQFSPSEDYRQYPRAQQEDVKKLREEGVDAVVIPKDPKEVYPEAWDTWVRPRRALTEILEGKYRPHHFEGVATVVLKLFSIVQPHRAYFGEKDYQQLQVIRSMVQDLSLPVEIRAGKTVREKSGLAMSSRNDYFSAWQREEAAKLYQTLKKSSMIREARLQLQSLGFGVEYLEAWEPDLSKPAMNNKGRWLVAARFCGVRLIDNVEKP